MIKILLLLILSINVSYAKDITDIKEWKHPVKTVFMGNKLSINKVEIKENIPTFFVNLQYDPQSPETSKYYNKFYFDVLAANGYLDYKIDDDADDLIISVHWKNKALDVTYLEKQPNELVNTY